jgi:hypothetical protein
LNKELDFHRNLYGKYTSSIGALVKQVKDERLDIKNQMKTILGDVEEQLIGLQRLEWDEKLVSVYLKRLEGQLTQQTQTLSMLITAIDL